MRTREHSGGNDPYFFIKRVLSQRKFDLFGQYMCAIEAKNSEEHGGDVYSQFRWIFVCEKVVDILVQKVFLHKNGQKIAIFMNTSEIFDLKCQS